MIASIKDINLAINKAIKTISDEKIISSDTEEGFKRPCFKVMFGDIDTSLVGISSIRREIIVRIYYFPSDFKKNNLELLSLQDSLALLFLKPIEIEELIIHIEGYVNRIVDNILQISFELKFIQDLDLIDDSEFINTLEMKGLM